MQEWKLEEIPVSELHEGIQIRIQTNEETVERYVEAIENNGGKWPFPPIDVYQIDGVFQIADGHHRKLAAEKCWFIHKIPCIVHEGDEADLLKKAYEGNSKNALQMTKDDIRHFREIVIQKFPNKSDRDLADICGCSAMTINRDKSRLKEKGSFERPETVIGKDGKEYKIGGTELLNPRKTYRLSVVVHSGEIKDPEELFKMLQKDLPRTIRTEDGDEIEFIDCILPDNEKFKYNPDGTKPNFTKFYICCRDNGKEYRHYITMAKYLHWKKEFGPSFDIDQNLEECCTYYNELFGRDMLGSGIVESKVYSWLLRNWKQENRKQNYTKSQSPYRDQGRTFEDVQY